MGYLTRPMKLMDIVLLSLLVVNGVGRSEACLVSLGGRDQGIPRQFYRRAGSGEGPSLPG